MTSRVMRLLALVASVAMIALVGAIGLGTSAAAPPDRGGAQSAPVSGVTDTGQQLTGNFTATQFIKGTSQTGLMAVGQLTGTLGGQQVSQQVTLPVNQITGSCEILDLVLGPLDLNLLGLVVHLDTVHLNITAQSGPGNLLGNLLCAVAGLLDNPSGNINGILNLLNRILGALG
ncbi:hypothetical protein A5662_00150 [Mycobacteriaceae bacterium 1482268.1]|nr:hypothetical protein A5662_00150 [Mycobacteriaceae bacterium 1482268.1]